MKLGIDYSVCRLIDEQMWFITYDDFVGRRLGIKRLFQQMSLDAKTFYQWYVYANIHMSEYFKNAIWDYLVWDDPEYEFELTKLSQTYKAKQEG